MLFFETPAFEPWAKEVAALPAEKQVEEVSKKLVELNPGFDGKLRHEIVNDVVQVLAFETDHVTDISPVRALVGLRRLQCQGGYPDQGQLADLSPLKGLSLEVLAVIGNKVSDLSPLQGMPLAYLTLDRTLVTDLSSLHGLQLKQIWLRNALVTDLSPLRQLPLEDLSLPYTMLPTSPRLKTCH